MRCGGRARGEGARGGGGVRDRVGSGVRAGVRAGVRVGVRLAVELVRGGE